MYLSAIWRILVGMHSGRTWRLSHLDALDGLRGVAILLVLVAHASPLNSWGVFGTAGVTMFFTLSGFLITALLIGERERLGRIRLGAFYRRRALRLLPALVAVVVVVSAIGLVVDDYATTAGALGALGYVANWVQGAGADLGALGHTWSLSIEEQFYLAWPLTMLAALRSSHWRGILYAVAGCAWIYALVMRWVVWFAAGPDRVYNATDLRMDALLVGCSLAIWMTARPEPATPRGPRFGMVVDGALLVALVALLWMGDAVNAYLLIPAWWPLVVVVLIRWVVTPGYRGLFTHPVIRRIGQRSYGLYLWHVPILMLAERADLPHWPTVAGAYAAAWVATEASWRFIEQPFLRLKDRQSRSERIEVRVGAGV